MNEAVLKPGREKSLLRRHPWVFAGAVERLSGRPESGETVLIRDAGGNPMAFGAYSPHSNIRLRVWTWDTSDIIDPSFFQRRLDGAILARQIGREAQSLQGFSTDSLRLVHAESDGLPGLVVDQYGDTLVMQCLSAGVEPWRETIADILMQLTGAERLYERSDVDVRALEGLPARTGCLRGSEPPQWIQIHEGALSYWVDIRHGHKTGFYLDQRENRWRVRQLAKERQVLDCFSYTGGFALAALAGGASFVTAVDSSEDALALAKENLALNQLPTGQIEWIEGDVFRTLRGLRDRDRSFDMIILDPPKFAPTAAQAERASRGYKDINLLAFKLLRPGGILATFSCSGGVSEELFQKIVFGAALDAGVEAQIIARMHQGFDHPVALNFPEGAYLKGYLIVIRLVSEGF